MTLTLARAALALVAVGLFWFALQLHLVGARSEGWSSISGVVTTSYVRTAGVGAEGNVDMHSPVVTYTYRVGSEDYTGSRIAFGEFFSNLHSSRRRVQSFPDRSKVTVYFDSQNPGDAVLDRTYPAVPIAMLTAFALIALAAAAFLPRLTRAIVNSVMPGRP